MTVAGGLRAVPGSAHDISNAFGGSRWQYVREVRVPSALPSVVTAMKISSLAAFVAAIVGEFFGASRGLGVYLVAQAAQLETASVWATALVITMVTVAGGASIALFGRALAHRYTSVAGGIITAVNRSPRSPGRVAASILGAVLTLVTLRIGYLRRFGICSFVGETPADVLHFLGDQGARSNRNAVLHALGTTISDSAVVMLVGWLGAALVSVAFVMLPSVARVVMPIAVGLRSIPIIGILPLLTLVFGRGLTGTTVVIGVIMSFPTLVLTLAGLANVGPDLLAVGHVYGTPSQALRKLRLHVAVPQLCASRRICAPSAILGPLLTEWLATGKGHGAIILTAATRSKYDQLWAAVLVTTVFAVAAYQAATILERSVTRRHSGTV